MLRGGLKAQFHDKFDSADEILHACIRDDDVPHLQQLLHATPAPDINYSHCEFGPPIYFAALCGNGDAIDLLLAAGADAFVRRTEQQETAMGIAARKGHRDIVKRLWTCRPPESHAKGIKSQTCLVIAAMHGRTSIVEDMLDWWDDWPQDSKIEALRRATRWWHFGVVNLLLKRESFEQPTVQDMLYSATAAKLTDDNVKCVVVDYADQQLLIASLIDAGADPNYNSYEPLIYTVAGNAYRTLALKTLLEKGADPNKTNRSGMSALHVLTAPPPAPFIGLGPDTPNETAIHLLLLHKASVSQPDKAGECPIHWAAYGFDLRLFRVYLDSHPGPDRNTLLRLANNNGETLLHYAAAGCHLDVMEYLISQGLDINATSSNSWTPLMCALAPISRNAVWQTEVKTLGEAIRAAYLLISHGANPNIMTNEDWTPLHVLALYLDETGKAEELAKDLISGGIDTEASAPLLSLPTMLSFDPMPSTVPWGYRLRDKMADTSARKEVIRHGLMPIHWAAERGAVGVIRALVANGANVSITDMSGAYPARIAAESIFLKMRTGTADNIVNILVGAGAGL
jgi:ankyrin repeat protein